ncbi:hypothetical protein [Aestuariibius sp. HNIBRBA575]|uniref:hypothetical protein n=1 Tax=Aestuariibius sp. HNIBRBA575 TaxID=3233343 RepID=UPI0034A29E88
MPSIADTLSSRNVDLVDAVYAMQGPDGRPFILWLEHSQDPAAIGEKDVYVATEGQEAAPFSLGFRLSPTQDLKFAVDDVAQRVTVGLASQGTLPKDQDFQVELSVNEGNVTLLRSFSPAKLHS